MKFGYPGLSQPELYSSDFEFQLGLVFQIASIAWAQAHANPDLGLELGCPNNQPDLLELHRD